MVVSVRVQRVVNDSHCCAALEREDRELPRAKTISKQASASVALVPGSGSWDPWALLSLPPRIVDGHGRPRGSRHVLDVMRYLDMVTNGTDTREYTHTVVAVVDVVLRPV